MLFEIVIHFYKDKIRRKLFGVWPGGWNTTTISM